MFDEFAFAKFAGFEIVIDDVDCVCDEFLFAKCDGLISCSMSLFVCSMSLVDGCVWCSMGLCGVAAMMILMMTNAMAMTLTTTLPMPMPMMSMSLSMS